MKRRDFVSMLIGASTASILVPKRVFSLPKPPTGILNTVYPYLTSKDAWFIKTDMPDGIALYSREHPFYAMTENGLTELNEESIETLYIEIRKLTDDQTGRLFSRMTRRSA